MKKYSRLLALVAALVICLAPIFGSALTAKADGAITYYVSYVEEKGEWRYQTGNGWDDNMANYSMKSLQSAIKDGDLLVIDGDGRI